ncbi:hypothetical protein WICMUC_005005 [Wickerhamomyces mucosus]|uniref:Uncharacterized protein n=1 Tax=Wickerhamomyces mucosus TaxID=1378264 RepID=A0A9P8T7T8_9ASCO|nr:hypothetical protein WICMUC_005005 [Wickerhamomyces mucosus]
MSEQPILLLPDIHDENYNIDDEVYTLIYDIPEPIRSIDWNGNLLALGHKEGITILAPIPSNSQIAKNFPNKFQQDWIFQINKISTKSPVNKLRFTSKYLISSHEDNSIGIFNQQTGLEIKLNTSIHKDEINNLDISNNGGFIVVSSDDKIVSIFDLNKTNNKPIFTIKLDNIPTLIKFWIDNDYDKLIIVENGNVVKIYNWKLSKWLISIYPISYSKNLKPFIKDVIILNNKITIIGESGYIKKYDLNNLKGGAGYTFPNESFQLSGWLNNSKYISSNSKPLIGGINVDRCSFYDFNTNSNTHQIYQFKLNLPSLSISSGSINHKGIVAFNSGAKLLLVRPFDSYEVV